MVQLVSPETQLQRFALRRRIVTLDAIEARGERMVRCWFIGDDLTDFVSPNSGDHVKLQVPNREGALTEPQQDAETGRILNRPELQLRDMTPRIVSSGCIAIDMVRHDGGVIGKWLQRAAVGDRCAILGPRGSKAIIEPLDTLIAVVDLTALPAAERRFRELDLPGQLHLIGSGDMSVDVDARVQVIHHAEVHGWHEANSSAIAVLPSEGRTFVWGAGEAAGVSNLRAAVRECNRDGLFAQFNGYWQRGVSEYDHHAQLPEPSTSGAEHEL